MSGKVEILTLIGHDAGLGERPSLRRGIGGWLKEMLGRRGLMGEVQIPDFDDEYDDQVVGGATAQADYDCMDWGDESVGAVCDDAITVDPDVEQWRSQTSAERRASQQRVAVLMEGWTKERAFRETLDDGA